jgi:hypothetical protein
MKYLDIISLMNPPYNHKIKYIEWGEKKYTINGHKITRKQIQRLKEELNLKEYYNKDAPLTGGLR